MSGFGVAGGGGGLLEDDPGVVAGAAVEVALAVGGLGEEVGVGFPVGEGGVGAPGVEGFAVVLQIPEGTLPVPDEGASWPCPMLASPSLFQVVEVFGGEAEGVGAGGFIYFCTRDTKCHRF